MSVKYLKLFWYQIFVHWNLILLDFLLDFVLKFFVKWKFQVVSAQFYAVDELKQRGLLIIVLW